MLHEVVSHVAEGFVDEPWDFPPQTEMQKLQLQSVSHTAGFAVSRAVQGLGFNPKALKRPVCRSGTQCGVATGTRGLPGRLCSGAEPKASKANAKEAGA